MAKKKKADMPEIIWVTRDDQSYLLVWDRLDDADEGAVASYKLVEELEKRHVSEVRRKGSKKWFKP